MKILRNLIILGILGYLGWTYVLKREPGDQPAVQILNGPLRIEAQSNRLGRGTFAKSRFSLDNAWYYHHPAHGPSRLEVVINDSSCGGEARYNTDEVRIISSGSGTSSMLTVSIFGFGPLTSLMIQPQSDTKMTPDPRAAYRLMIGGAEDQLMSVKVAGSMCAFTAGEGSITITPHQ